MIWVIIFDVSYNGFGLALFGNDAFWFKDAVRAADVVADSSTELVDGGDVTFVVELRFADDDARITERFSITFD